MAPPPPPAPPPLPKGLGASSNHGKSNNFEPPPDRNALLSQIRKGTRLKKAETNDRSAPLVDGKKPSSNGTIKQNTDSKSNSPFPIIPPGGLFAQGIPKLRPTVPKFGDSSGLNSNVIQSLKASKQTSSLDHLRVGQLGGSRSQPPSPVSKPRMSSGVVSSQTDIRQNSSGGNPNFPDDVNIKGPAPAPPPASQKPVFKSNTRVENNEQAPSKLTTVKRSASQTNLGQRPRLTRPPPNVKPPPPPKCNGPPQSAPPPPPSKPPNILRRQSFGVGEGQNLRQTANKLTVCSTVSKATGKSIGPPPPPPPPRNNSAPHDLNQMITNSSTGNHWNKMSIAPPPPPPNRIMAGGNRAAPTRPPAPRSLAPPPPPPPQHQTAAHPAPPSQLKATPSSNSAPPPPARVSSMKQTADFEDRFKFHPAQSLPKPERFSNTAKTYPSKANQSRQKQNTRRLPPPPPPQSGSGVPDATRGQPVLHIQLESGIFSNNFAHS